MRHKNVVRVDCLALAQFMNFKIDFRIFLPQHLQNQIYQINVIQPNTPYACAR